MFILNSQPNENNKLSNRLDNSGSLDGNAFFICKYCPYNENCTMSITLIDEETRLISMLHLQKQNGFRDSPCRHGFSGILPILGFILMSDSLQSDEYVDDQSCQTHPWPGHQWEIELS